MYRALRSTVFTLLLLCLVTPEAILAAPQGETPRPEFGVLYTAWIRAADPWATVRVRLTRNPEWVRWMRFEIDPARYRAFKGTGQITREGNVVLWKPPAQDAYIEYGVSLESKRDSGRYDGIVTPTWALFRADDLVPVKRVDFQDGTQSAAKLRLNVPSGWSIETPYPRYKSGRLDLDDPRGHFDRPVGWVLLGQIGARRDTIGRSRVTVAAPTGAGLRRMDILAFFRWTLPELQKIFPGFTQRLLVVGAGDPMWRGALSGPSSLFVHADRPLISENATSTFLHEVVHVAMNARSGPKSDWIVEGMAEYYSLEALRRSGTISNERFEESQKTLAAWAARDAGPLEAPVSTGATTARAVGVLRRVDAEIRARSAGRRSLDDVAAALASQSRAITLEIFRHAAEQAAGAPLESLSPAALQAPPPST